MKHLRRSITILLLLLMSGILAMPNFAFANTVDFSVQTEMHIQHHDAELCSDACGMESGLSCAQHCDHQNVIPLNLPRIPHLHLASDNPSNIVRFLPMPALLVELKPPQIAL